MTSHSLKSSAKSARRSLALTLLGVLVMLVAAGAIYAAAAKEDFALSVSPSTQTVTGTKTVTSSITLSRSGGYAKAVALSVRGLPANTQASLSPTTIPSSANTATLTISTNVGGKTPPGNYTLTITGADGRLTRSTTMLLAIKAASEQNFTVAAAPTSRTVVQGESTTYDVTVTRSGGFNGPIAISATGLPSGAALAPFTIPSGATTGVATINSASSAATGTFQPTLVGTATLDTGSTARSATVTYIVSQGRDFQLSGNLGQALSPGTSVPLNLTITNPNNFDLKVSGINVSVEERTSKTGCSGTQNLRVTPLNASLYPIAVPAGQSRTLQQLGIAAADMPKVSMLNLATNQNACKGASYNLQYGGTASK